MLQCVGLCSILWDGKLSSQSRETKEFLFHSITLPGLCSRPGWIRPHPSPQGLTFKSYFLCTVSLWLKTFLVTTM